MNNKPYKIGVSVIMLTYNREEFLKKALSAICNQTYKDIEIIVIDNGSNDNTYNISERFAFKDKRIKVVHIKKNTISFARNLGIEMANGEYITFIDDDDIAHTDMVEFLYNLAIENNADVSICGSFKINNKVTSENYVYDECLIMNSLDAVVEMLKRKKYNTGLPTKLIKRELIEKFRFNDDSKYDDIGVCYKILANADKVVAHGLPKYDINRHYGNNSIFTTNDLYLTEEQLFEYINVFKERTRYLSEKFPERKSYFKYTEWSYMISMCNKIIINKLESCKKPLSLMKSILIKNYNEFYNSEYTQEFEREYLRKYIKLYTYKNIKNIDGDATIYDNSVIELSENSIINLNANFIMNANKLKFSKAEAYLKMHSKSILNVNGEFQMYYNSTIQIFENAVLSLGKGYINSNAVISCCNRIDIEDGATIARGVHIYDGDFHNIVDQDGKIINKSKPIHIGKNVWIGLNSIILKGVTIGEGAVVAAGSVVTHDVPERCMVAGNPAKVVRNNVIWK